MKKKEFIEKIYTIAGGVKSEFDKLWGTDIFEYYTIEDLWLDRIKKDNERRRQNRGKK